MSNVRSQFHAEALALGDQLAEMGVAYSIRQDSRLSRHWRIQGERKEMSTSQVRAWIEART